LRAPGNLQVLWAVPSRDTFPLRLVFSGGSTMCRLLPRAPTIIAERCRTVVRDRLPDNLRIFSFQQCQGFTEMPRRHACGTNARDACMIRNNVNHRPLRPGADARCSTGQSSEQITDAESYQNRGQGLLLDHVAQARNLLLRLASRLVVNSACVLASPATSPTLCCTRPAISRAVPPVSLIVFSKETVINARCGRRVLG
jgi:hypothetical protein